jgi:hypothetical protein
MMAMSRTPRLFRILAALDDHFAADDISPADVDRWRELKKHITRMHDGLDMARIEVRSRPLTEGLARTIERHLKFGLGENSA